MSADTTQQGVSRAGALWPEPRKEGAGDARVREAAVSLDDDVETARASEGARRVPDVGDDVDTLDSGGLPARDMGGRRAVVAPCPWPDAGVGRRES